LGKVKKNRKRAATTEGREENREENKIKIAQARQGTHRVEEEGTFTLLVTLRRPSSGGERESGGNKGPLRKRKRKLTSCGQKKRGTQRQGYYSRAGREVKKNDDFNAFKNNVGKW